MAQVMKAKREENIPVLSGRLVQCISSDIGMTLVEIRLLVRINRTFLTVGCEATCITIVRFIVGQRLNWAVPADIKRSPWAFRV